MKTVPTETDREAARLFDPAPGMRIILSDRLFGGLWARVSVTGERMAGCYEVGVDTWDAWVKEWQRMDAIDTDDHATVGQMLAQVEEAYGVSAELYALPDGWACVCIPGVAEFNSRTRGGVLLLAMRTIKSKL